MKILREFLLNNDLKKIYRQPLGTQIKYFWNKGWSEVPELMMTTPLAFLAIAILVGTRTLYPEKYSMQLRYHRDIVLYRPDDPRAASIRKDESYYII